MFSTTGALTIKNNSNECDCGDCSLCWSRINNSSPDTSDMDSEMSESFNNKVSIDDKEAFKLNISDILNTSSDNSDNRFKTKMRKFITGWTNYYITNKDGIYENSKIYWYKFKRYSKRLPNKNLAISTSYKKLIDTQSHHKLTVLFWLEYQEFIQYSKEEYKLACTKFTITHDEKQALITQYFGKITTDNIKLLAKKQEEDIAYTRFIKGLHHRRFLLLQKKINGLENYPYNIDYIKSIKNKEELVRIVLKQMMSKSKTSNKKIRDH